MNHPVPRDPELPRRGRAAASSPPPPPPDTATGRIARDLQPQPIPAVMAISQRSVPTLVLAGLLPVVTMLVFAWIYSSPPMYIAGAVTAVVLVIASNRAMHMQIVNTPAVVRAARKQKATVTEHYEGVHWVDYTTYKTSDYTRADEVTWKIQQTMTEPTEWVTMAAESGKPVGAVHLHDGEVQATLQIKAPLVVLTGRPVKDYIHMY